MQTLIAAYSFVIGTAFGSFALAMVDRMKAGKDWVKGRSECDHCNHKLGIYDLIPIASWVSQRGRCRYCSKKLSTFYPLVEIGTGLAFLGSYLLVPYEISGVSAVMFGLWLSGIVLMSALMVFDLRWYLLPNKIIYPLISVAFVHRLVQFSVVSMDYKDAILSTFAALLVGSGLFWALYQASKGKWIGDGDYRLGFAMALFLADPLMTWLALFIASVTGIIFALPMLLKGTKNKKAKLKSKIPFGPFLMVGLYFSYIYGQQIIDWYIDSFLYL